MSSSGEPWLPSTLVQERERRELEGRDHHLVTLGHGFGRELPPLLQRVDASRVLARQLDPSLPAGLSPAVVQQELRTRNNFTGVTITDALEAGALSAYGTPGQRAVAAAYAGMDLLLCSARDVSQGEDATSALALAYGSGQLEPTPFNAAVTRVQALRSSLS